MKDGGEKAGLQQENSSPSMFYKKVLDNVLSELSIVEKQLEAHYAPVHD